MSALHAAHGIGTTTKKTEGHFTVFFHTTPTVNEILKKKKNYRCVDGPLMKANEQAIKRS